MSKIINLTIDGRNVEAEDKTMLLEILNDQGIFVPQLCSYPSLTPNGACRLCMVEISQKEWQGKSKIVASCLYPAEEGLSVSTRSKDVLTIRRTMLELYMARCPDSEEIRNIARLEGLDDTPFPIKEKADKCIMCGLCTRVCQDCGPGAISTMSRGIDKHIGPELAGAAENCTGCRACAYICPTDAIPISQKDQTLTIWDRNFEIPICEVETEKCRGCGICEEVCPYSIPRVNLFKNRPSAAYISPSTCTGCGICAGSCPSGAISQVKTGLLNDYETGLFKKDLTGKTIIFSCPRSPLPSGDDNIIQVSCIGSVDISLLLYVIAAGAKGAALMCRDKLTCPYRRGGENGKKTLEVAKNLLKLCGIGEERVALIEPEPGQDGPARAWQQFAESVSLFPPLLQEYYLASAVKTSGLDLALDLVDWLKNRPELRPSLPVEIEAVFTQTSEESPYLLYLDRLPELHLIFPLVLDQPVVIDILQDTSRLLKQKNIPVRCVFTEKELQKDKQSKIITYTKPDHITLPPAAEVITLNKLAGLPEAIEEERFSFSVNTSARRELNEALKHSGKIPIVSTPELYLQYALLMRPGSWQECLKEKPVLEFTAVLSPTEKNKDHHLKLRRIKQHPILPPLNRDELTFTFNKIPITALKGEVITSALYAAGITIFGHHPRDGGAQGIYCVNGQCSQCMVIADGTPVKGCMTPVTEGMHVESLEGYPVLADDTVLSEYTTKPLEVETEVLVIGGGPAGISAAIELGNVGADVLIVDDKQELGGKLSLQTHNFFGSVKDCYAGYRGIDIGHILAENAHKLPTVKIWLNSTVVGVFSDGKFGVSTGGTFRLVKPRRTLFATGAREKSLAFPGCDLPGVYGAGAFQTLANRDLIRCAEKLFIVGGGNVGLIGAYHALQAGIDVVGLVEALPQCGGYKVHLDKIKRMGVPVMTSHTVLSIEGGENVERVVIAAVDDKFQPVAGTERAFEVDTVLIAVGLSPVDELMQKANQYGLDIYAAGDAKEIAEASAAIFSGKIAGRRIAQAIGLDLPVPGNWEEFGELLKHHSADAVDFLAEDREDPVYPLIRCVQEIPCNPCIEACPQKCITMTDSILDLPTFNEQCIGCGNCVLACPGLAINLVLNDYDPNQEKALLMLPYEFNLEKIPFDQEVSTTDLNGEMVGKGKVVAYKERESQNSRVLLLVEVPLEDKLKVAGFKIREIDPGIKLETAASEEDPIVCRCERIRKSEIVNAIHRGVRDMNQLKAEVRAGLGACNGKTCTELILRIFREEGIPFSEVTMPTHRPLVSEVHLGDFITLNNLCPDQRTEETG
ncbi:MAG: 2Fe-2S iron-sulfur cluster-binding protein [Bacillota bacterium]